MKRESLVFIFGVLILVVPFLGIPSVWKNVVLVLFGLVLVLIGYQLRHRAYIRSIEHNDGERRTEIYREAIPENEDEVKGRPSRISTDVYKSRRV